MISFINKFEINNFLNNNLKKYQIVPKNKYVITQYVHKLFDIKVYQTNLITINGAKEKDIYNKFINILDEDNYIGMDEVGVGDFFGPTVYCLVKINNKQKFINKFVSIKDSKKMTDKQILNTYNKIKDVIEYKIQIVYDKDIDKNLNSIEQKMYYHYKNYKTITTNNEDKIIIDLFTTEKNFYKVANKLNISYPEELYLTTKADSKYFCVALASIVARYHFIKQMDMLKQKYNFNFNYGANVLEQAQNFCNLYSKDELSNFCKITFKTFNEIS